MKNWMDLNGDGKIDGAEMDIRQTRKLGRKFLS